MSDSALTLLALTVPTLLVYAGIVTLWDAGFFTLIREIVQEVRSSQ